MAACQDRHQGQANDVVFATDDRAQGGFEPGSPRGSNSGGFWRHLLDSTIRVVGAECYRSLWNELHKNGIMPSPPGFCISIAGEITQGSFVGNLQAAVESSILLAPRSAGSRTLDGP